MDTRLKHLKVDLESAVAGMSSEQLAWHPQGKWCAADVLEHLFLSYTGTIGALERVLRKGKPQISHASLKQHVLTLLVIGFGRIPPGVKAPAIVQPKGLSSDTVRNGIGEKLTAMDTIIAECEARFGSRVKLLDHPILGPLNATQWRKLHVVHGRHHLQQILRLREGAMAQLT